MYRKAFPVLLLLLLSQLAVFAQQFPVGYFRNPLDTDMVLAGSFGELRPNHFHTGVDIKTNGVEGLPVYAAADGYISQISISGYGYGNMLMIAHPNGYTTLYGHLQRFIPPIQQYTRNAQYARRKFDIDTNLAPNVFPVKKGQLIGYSGNTGGSRAPHLHFEIRETKGNRPINPLLCGFHMPDTIPPSIYAIKIYPMDSNSYVRVYYSGGKKGASAAAYGQNIKIYVARINGRNYLRGVSRIEGLGRLGFSIDANDHKNNSYNTMGVYSIQLCVDETPIYTHAMRILDFDLKRFINAHIDYPEMKRYGRWFEKSFILPGNVLPIYKGVKQDGTATLKAGNDYRLSYYADDENDNLSVLVFDIHSPAGPVNRPPVPQAKYDTLIPFNKKVSFSRPGFIARFPANTFYDDIPLEFEVKPKPVNGYSLMYEMGTPYYPVNDYFRVGIQTEGLPPELISKAFIYAYPRGYIGGEYKDGWMIANSLTLGKFFVATDTKPPTLTPINITNGRNMSRDKTIKFVIKDNLAGIEAFNGYVDGKWILFQYDPRIALIYYEFDSHVGPGKHTLTMELTDRVHNITRVNYTFYR